MEKGKKEEALPNSRQVCKVMGAQLGEQIGDYAALSVAADLLEKNGQNGRFDL